VTNCIQVQVSGTFTDVPPSMPFHKRFLALEEPQFKEAGFPVKESSLREGRLTVLEFGFGYDTAMSMSSEGVKYSKIQSIVFPNTKTRTKRGPTKLPIFKYFLNRCPVLKGGDAMDSA